MRNEEKVIMFTCYEMKYTCLNNRNVFEIKINLYYGSYFFLSERLSIFSTTIAKKKIQRPTQYKKILKNYNKNYGF